MSDSPALVDEASAPRPTRPRQPRPRAEPAATEPTVKGPTATGVASGPLPAAVTEIVALFERRSEELRFPNIDAEKLRAQLERVERLRVEATEALRHWERVRAESEQCEVELAEMSKRAVAYARVFAADDPSLTTELDSILNSEPERGKRRKRDAGAVDADAPSAAEPQRTRRPRAARAVVENGSAPSTDSAPN